jgi:hypothetical protein
MRWRAQILLVLVAACASAFAWASDPAGYDTVRIIVPQDQATVHDNEGNLDVSVEVSPPLRSDAGNHIVFLLDGRVVASGTEVRIRLTDVDRGTHTLQAQVATADGALLLASPVTSFYMWRASRLHPGRKN